MKTLIIHPEDRSTDFLKPIYANIPNPTVITGGVTKAKIASLISEHDRIFMMGHGCPYGLFSCAKFGDSNYSGYIIDSTMVPLLEEKECVFIWCNADQFVNRYKLNGLYSGMFISEVMEATYCGLPGTPQEIVDESNHSFARWLGDNTNKPLYEMYHSMMDSYEMLAENNTVALYNSGRLFLRQEVKIEEAEQIL